MIATKCSVGLVSRILLVFSKWHVEKAKSAYQMLETAKTENIAHLTAKYRGGTAIWCVAA